MVSLSDGYPHPEAILKLPSSHTVNMTNSLLKESMGGTVLSEPEIGGKDIVYAPHYIHTFQSHSCLNNGYN